MRLFFFLFIIVFSFTQINGSPSKDSVSADPDTWKITYETVFDAEGKPVHESIEKLLKNLESLEGEGIPFSRDEFMMLLRRKEAAEVYTKELVRYATPKSRHIQKQQHNNYRKVFLKEKRIVAGVNFLGKYKTLLTNVEKQYGVARKDIVAILMWESGLGEFTGKHRVFNIFMGQLLFLEQAQEYAINQMKLKGEEYPNDKTDTPETQERRFAALRRSAVSGLTSLLRYSKLHGYDPLLQKGSWGGAIGFTQFMPYRLNLAVDGDNDGDVDLFSWPDAIHSVANYLKELGNYGWEYSRRKKGIYSYNHSDEYVHGVIAYADAIWKRYRGK